MNNIPKSDTVKVKRDGVWTEPMPMEDFIKNGGDFQNIEAVVINHVLTKKEIESWKKVVGSKGTS